MKVIKRRDLETRFWGPEGSIWTWPLTPKIWKVKRDKTRKCSQKVKVIKQGSGVQQSRQHLQAVLPELGLSPRPMPPPSHCSPTERPMPTRGLFFLKIQLKVKVNWKFTCLLFYRDHCTHRQKVKAWMGKKLQSVSYAQVPFYYSPSWRQNHTLIYLKKNVK